MVRSAAGRGAWWGLRAVLLSALTAVALAYQACLAFDVLTARHAARGFGFDAVPVNGILTITSVAPTDSSGLATSAYKAGLREGDEILAIRVAGGETRTIGGLFECVSALRALRTDRPWSVLLRRSVKDGSRSFAMAELAPSPHGGSGPSLRSITSKIVLPLGCIAMAVLIGFLKLDDPNAFLASMLLFCFAGAAWGGESYAAFPPGLRELGLVVYVALFSSWSYLFLRFFLLFPAASPLDRAAPWLKSVLAVFPVLFTVWNANWAYMEALSARRFAELAASGKGVDKTLDIIFLALFAMGFLSLLLNLARAPSRADQRRLAFLMAGAVGIVPLLTLYFFKAVLWAPPVPEWLYFITAVGLGLFPVVFAFAVVKHRVFGIRLILHSGLQFALMSKGFLFLEGALLFLAIFYASDPLLGKLLHGASAGTLALATALITMGAVLAVRRINRRVMREIERLFFREAYDGRRILMDLSKAVGRLAMDPQAILALVTTKVLDSLHPCQAAVFIKGADVARLPLQGESRTGALLRLAEGHPEDYLCLCWQAGSGLNSAVAFSPEGTLAFRGDSMTVKQIEGLAQAEPRALDVDLDDTRSWTSALRRAHHNDSQPQIELALLARYRVRLLVPLLAGSRLMGFISLSEKQSEEPYSSEDKELLLTVGQQVALSLQHGEFLKQEAEELNLRKELEIAQRVQERLFPHVLPSVPGLLYAGTCKPARGVGGDYYDFLDLEPGHLGMALGDVTGKGISAALLMATLQAMLRIHCEAHRDDPERLTSDINRHMCRAMEAERFASFFYGVFDSATRSLTYVNAGHNPPMLFRPGYARRHSVGAQAVSKEPGAPCSIIRLNPTGMVLGVLGDAVYKRETIALQPGDLLLVFTDGVTEAVNTEGDLYGEEALSALVASVLDLSPAEILDAVVEDVRRHAGQAPQADDITLIVARVSAG